jgi:hypothetical protein
VGMLNVSPTMSAVSMKVLPWASRAILVRFATKRSVRDDNPAQIQHTWRNGHEHSDIKQKRSPSYGDLFLARRREGDSPNRAYFDSPVSRQTTVPWCVTSDLSTLQTFKLGPKWLASSAPRIHSGAPLVHHLCTKRSTRSLSPLPALDSAARSKSSKHYPKLNLRNRAVIGQLPSSPFDELQQRLTPDIILLHLAPRVKGNVFIHDVLDCVGG